MCILIFFPNYINIYFKKDKVKGYKGPQTLTCIDKKNISKAQHILLPLVYHSGNALYYTLLVKTIFDTAPCFNDIGLDLVDLSVFCTACTVIYIVNPLLPVKGFVEYWYLRN